MCEFCNDDKVNYLKDKSNLRFYIMEDTVQRWVLGAECDDCRSEEIIEINYCPKCGRELLSFVERINNEIQSAFKVPKDLI